MDTKLNIIDGIHIPRHPWTGIGKRIESAMRMAMFDYKMVENVPSVAVALSGGKDSLALLFMLKTITGRGFPPFDIFAVHVGGEFSCGAGITTSYLKRVCDALEVPLLVRESTQKLETLECYSCSRERRRLIFDAAKSVGATTVAFGHHKDDHAQTLLMNLLHTAEFAGLMPKIKMEDYGVTIIRPLIYTREHEITTFADHYGFRRSMCRCPVGQESMRKKVDDLLKDIEHLYPNARNNIAQAGFAQGSQKALINHP
jgi:tRNA(Ile)-lysidine synthase TilS/MesJ